MKKISRTQSQSITDSKNGPELARSGPLSKTVVRSKADSRYWLEGKRLVHHDSPNYSVRMQAGGRRVWFPLGTPNKTKAAKKASDIYAFIQSEGLDAAVREYKVTQAEKGATVGALIEAFEKVSTARPHTLDAYAKALRCIVAEIKGIEAVRPEEGQGRDFDAWRQRVNRVALSSITPADVVAWKNSRLRDANSDPLAKRRAIVTVNSLVRNAKAVFGKKTLPFVEQLVTLPRPLPFDGVMMEKPPSMRYQSRIDAFAILAKAKEDLAGKSPEAFKVMILALVCGLRRSEIDHLLWRSFDFTRRVLRVESTEFHQLKSEDSAGLIDLDEDTVRLLRGFRAKAPTAQFVINSSRLPRIEIASRSYRCDPVFQEVLQWLRANGVDAAKPLHTMRKEIGSIIASEHGIFEASRYLRHSDIRITSSIYADKKAIVTPRTFEGLFSGDDDEPVDLAERRKA